MKLKNDIKATKCQLAPNHSQHQMQRAKPIVANFTANQLIKFWSSMSLK